MEVFLWKNYGDLATCADTWHSHAAKSLKCITVVHGQCTLRSSWILPHLPTAWAKFRRVAPASKQNTISPRRAQRQISALDTE